MLKTCPNDQLIAHLFDAQPDSVIWFVPLFATDDPTCIIDFETRYCNQVAAQAFGLQPDDIIGEHLLSSSLIDHNTRIRVFKQCLHVWHTGESVEFTYHCQQSDNYYKVQRRRIHEGILNISQDCSREVKTELLRQEQEKTYQQLLDASGDGVLLLKAIRDNHEDIVDFQITFCNKWGRKIGKFTPDAIGKSLFEVLPHLRNHEQLQLHKHVIETGEPLQFETSFRNREGEEYGWFIVSLTKLNDGVISRYTDITQRKQYEKQIERQKEELQSILDSSINGVLACEAIRDSGGKIVDLLIGRVNASFTKLIGIETEEAEGRTFLSLFSNNDAATIFRAYCQVIETGKNMRTEFHYKSDNLEGWFDISAVKRGTNGIVISLINITATKRAQLELEKTVQELKQSNKSLEEFAYAASHDLQEPLRKIQLFNDRLKETFLPGSDKNHQVMFDRIHASAKRMRMLIENLMTFSSVNQQKSSFEPVNLQDLLQEVMQDFENIVEERSATITIGQMPEVYGDRMQLLRMFQNLLDNSLRYTATDRTPHIIVRAAIVPGSDVNEIMDENHRKKLYYQIQIEDNGIGFDMRYVHKIFQVFQRLHGNAEYKGTGIGLAIVQKVIENHSGFIRAESCPGKGSVFTLLLPVHMKAETATNK